MYKRAIITGITGQDGSYLAELLLGEGYEVHGIIRRSSTFSTGRIDHLYQDPHEDTKLFLHYGDLTDESSLRRIIEEVQPGEIYNLAAQSHVKVSFEQSIYTADVVALGTLRLLESIRLVNPKIRFYQASSSEMFGSSPPPQNEETPFHPRSPYGCAKVCAYHQVVNHREAYDMFACNGILFNHESPRRGETFVSRKVTRAAARIKLGLQEKLYLGNLDAKRDWGFAGDYVRAMWLMLQQNAPDDFVIANGKANTVESLCATAFRYLGLDHKEFVEIDQRYLRPSEVDHLLGDPSKAKEKLGWEPQVSFSELIEMMVDSDMELAEREKLLRDKGYNRHEQG